MGAVPSRPRNDWDIRPASHPSNPGLVADLLEAIGDVAEAVVDAAQVYVEPEYLPDQTTEQGVAPGFAEVAVGSAHVCALSETRTVYCWGANESGELGDGSCADRPTAVQVPGLSEVVQVVTGARFSCALREDGTVWCWGANQRGQLGDGSVTSRPRPVRVASAADVVSVSASAAGACASTRAGAVFCWGDGSQQDVAASDQASH